MFRPLLRHRLGGLSSPRSTLSPFTTSIRLLSSSHSKVYSSPDEAVKDIKSGSIVLSSGFGLCGTPDTLIDAISRNKEIQDLTCVSNNAGSGEKGLGELESHN